MTRRSCCWCGGRERSLLLELHSSEQSKLSNKEFINLITRQVPVTLMESYWVALLLARLADQGDTTRAAHIEGLIFTSAAAGGGGGGGLTTLPVWWSSCAIFASSWQNKILIVERCLKRKFWTFSLYSTAWLPANVLLPAKRSGEEKPSKISNSRPGQWSHICT